MIPNILVLADDLAGAAEIAAIAHNAGISARIIFEISELKSVTEEIVIINSNTRCDTSIGAYRKISTIMDQIDMDDYSLFYKMIDSDLRGSVISEANAILSKTKFDTVALIPANPSRNKNIQNSKYYLGNILLHETDYYNDPDFPIKVSDVLKLLENDMHESSLQPKNEVMLKENIIMPDIVTIQDIIISYNRLINDNILLCGGADFFKVMLFKKMGNQSFLYGYQKQLFILGSNSNNCINTIDLLQKKGVKIFQLPENTISKKQSLDKWEKQIFKLLINETKLAIVVPDKMDDSIGSPQKITSLLSTLIARVYHLIPCKYHFYIDGGETASSICKELNIIGLKIYEFTGDGMITFKDDNNNHYFTIKSSTYEWQELLVNNIDNG